MNGTNGGLVSPISNKPVSPIPELSPGDSVTALCQQLSQGLSQLTHSNSDDFNFNNQMSINQNQNQNNLTVRPMLNIQIFVYGGSLPFRSSACVVFVNVVACVPR